MADDLDQERFSGTREILDAHKFDVKNLEAYMAAHVDGFAGPLGVQQFKGGQSNPTYKLITPNKAYVMRRKPPGKLLPSAHAVDREFRVINGLYPTGFPVARPYALCEDESVVGTMFYIMDCVEGRIFWNGLLPDCSKTERGAIYDTMNDTLARLHSVDYEAQGLAEFGKPGNYFARQIGRWSKQYKASESDQIDEMNRLMEWLPENIPEDDATSIVHGDYRLDNMIFHPTEPKVLAVLDWELSTLGHPLGDFTYHLMQWRMPTADGPSGTLLGEDLPALGIPTEEDYIAAYCRRTGRDGIENIDFYFAYNFFRIAAILQGIAGRVRDGTASSPHAIERAKLVRPLAELGWKYAKAAGAP